jgi:FkbM family methyltransferase
MTEIKNDLWSYLASTNKPIVMYGMGNGADKILAVCDKKGIEIADFFASDGFVRGHAFHGKTVLSYSAVKEKYGVGNFIVLLSFASSLPDVIENIRRIAEECELYAPDVPVSGDNLFDLDFYRSNKESFDRARELLADEKSKKVFDCVIKYKLTGKTEYLFECESEPCEAFDNILSAESFEYTADLGAYNGDTARELKKYSPKLKKIYAFEPDRRNFRKLSEYAEKEDAFEVIPHNIAAWDKEEILTFGAEGNRNSGVGQTLVNGKTAKFTEVSANALDSVIPNDERIDYIKFDVEGAEKEALRGCYETIERHSPALLVSVYHRSEDLFALPLQIAESFPKYKLYLRKFRYIPAWDVNLYAVKK